eukprot:m51a1_g12624 hypothetical protein (113) ;mRNA; f:376-714
MASAMSNSDPMLPPLTPNSVSTPTERRNSSVRVTSASGPNGRTVLRRKRGGRGPVQRLGSLARASRSFAKGVCETRLAMSPRSSYWKNWMYSTSKCVPTGSNSQSALAVCVP